MSYREKYDYQLKRHGIAYSATANGLLVEADKELEAKEKVIAELSNKDIRGMLCIYKNGLSCGMIRARDSNSEEHQKRVIDSFLDLTKDNN